MVKNLLSKRHSGLGLSFDLDGLLWRFGRLQEGQHLRAPLGSFILFAMHAGGEDVLAHREDDHLGRAGIAVVRDGNPIMVLTTMLN